MMARRALGEILPSFLRRSLDLTPEQEDELDELQKDVDSRLSKILTDAQKKMLDQMHGTVPAVRAALALPAVVGQVRPGPGGPPPPPPDGTH